MRRVLILVVAALLPHATTAQDGDQERIEVLEEAARTRDMQLYREAQVAIRAWRDERRRVAKAAKAARAAGMPEPTAPERPQLGPVVRKYYDAAIEFAETERAVRFLVWIVTEGAVHDPNTARRALATMAEDHARSEALHDVIAEASAIGEVVGEAAMSSFCEALAEQGANPDLVGQLTLSQHAATIESADLDSNAYLAAKRALVAAAERDVSDRLAAEIRRTIARREDFGIGATAPDITGVDLDGVAFALSDYEGTVIFLDFWGDW